MSREPPCNIGPCPTRLPDPQYASWPLTTFIGKYCKLSFSCVQHPDRHEYMWVKVTGMGEEEDLRGVLDNDPVHNVGYKCGDELEFKCTEIIDVT